MLPLRQCFDRICIATVLYNIKRPINRIKFYMAEILTGKVEKNKKMIKKVA